MITVYGADSCEATQRVLRHLRRLGVMYSYRNVDTSAEALEQTRALNNGRRRTPTIDIDGETLVEPGSAVLTRALIERGQITRAETTGRLTARNVGDLDRAARFGGGLFDLILAWKVGRRFGWPLAVLGAYQVLTGAIGWCPVYSVAGISSLAGPLDRPREAERDAWFVSQAELAGLEDDAARLTAMSQ
jgi:mycoredoxin